ncbi:MAG: hypothetical protein DI539_24870 [Flavobacterium psychrophilum]|nr:MAG: hypothetical protein DI539_24870 [Flavobacterium psychrophilum]
MIYIPSMQYSHQDIFFLLSEDHLPALEHVDLSKEEIEELQLVPINKKLKIYASVIDLNKDEFTKNNWQSETSLDNADAKVQVAISFKSEIHWSEERQLIQINLSSEYKEQ